MNTKEIEYAATYAAHTSLTKAAERLGVSRSSVIRNVKSLEDELGTTLFINTLKGPVPTTSGSIFLKYAREIIKMEADLRFDLSEYGKYRGEIEVGMASNRSQYILPRVLPVFRKQYPHVTVHLHEKLQSDIISWIVEKHLDFAIVGESAVTDGLIFEPFVRDRLVMVAPQDDEFTASVAYERDGTAYIPIEKYLDKPIISGFLNQQSRRVLERIFKGFGASPQMVFESGNSYTVALLAYSGLGYAFCTEEAVRMHGGSHMPYYHIEPEYDAEWAIGIAHLETSPLSHIAEQLKQAIVTIIR